MCVPVVKQNAYQARNIDIIIIIIKGAMRVIVTARQTLTPGYERTLQRLVGILGVISKNPSNPNFDQFIFESISALMRYEMITLNSSFSPC
jgi:hypothetical protein